MSPENKPTRWIIGNVEAAKMRRSYNILTSRVFWWKFAFRNYMFESEQRFCRKTQYFHFPSVTWLKGILLCGETSGYCLSLRCITYYLQEHFSFRSVNFPLMTFPAPLLCPAPLSSSTLDLCVFLHLTVLQLCVSVSMQWSLDVSGCKVGTRVALNR